MLLSLWLVPGRFFRPEYMNDLWLLLAALNVRLACLLVGATVSLPSSAGDCLVGALTAATPPVRRADDDTSKSSSSSAPPGERHLCNREKGSKRSANIEEKHGRVMMGSQRRLPLVRARHPSVDTATLTC